MIQTVTFAVLFTVLTTNQAPATEPPAPVGRKVADFKLTHPSKNAEWSLAEASRDAKATVLVFLATGCPASTAYGPKLVELHNVFGDQGVTFAAIFSHPTDEPADIAAFAKSAGFRFPALHDADRTLAKKLAVERVPTAILLDASRTVRYAGRIDDQFAPGVHRGKATTKELINALKELLAEKEVTVKHVGGNTQMVITVGSNLVLAGPDRPNAVDTQQPANAPLANIKPCLLELHRHARTAIAAKAQAALFANVRQHFHVTA